MTEPSPGGSGTGDRHAKADLPAARDEGAGGGGIASAFEATYGEPPTHLAQAPGRVNLIGEHIDYAGLAVLPMAIQRRVRIAFRAVPDPEVRISSAASGFEPRAFRLDRPIEPYPPGDWGNYAKAAVLGALELVSAASRETQPGGIEALVVSDLPVAAGLGSSSALVIGCALAFAAAAGESVAPLTLAAKMAEAERLTGTRGGGMDQAISLCGRRDHASIVEFDPLGIAYVKVPEDWRFVVAYSLEEARKSGDAQITYNLRRRQVEAALSGVGEALGAPGASYRRLLADHAPDELLGVADRVLGRDLGRRFRHVISETVRVREAAEAMRDGDLDSLGDAMIASHRSLREDFEVSTPRLDQLVGICLEAGAAGARLTGAGLGGSIVALVAAERSDALLQALEDRFYSSRLPREAADGTSPLRAALFVARPSAGAAVEPIGSS